MQSRFIKNIVPSVKILILIILICTMLVAKSIFLMMSITILYLIIVTLLGGSVNKCVEFIKKIFIWLLFIVIMYIIIYKSTVGLFLFMYKTLLIAILTDSFICSLCFDELHGGIYGILKPLKIFKVNVFDCSYNIALNIVFLKELLYSSSKIESIQIENGKRSYRIKYFFLPRLLVSIDYVKKLDNSLKLKFYTLRYFKFNIKSVLLSILFILFFLMAIYKEVIL